MITKKFFHYLTSAMIVCCTTFTFTSCSDDDTPAEKAEGIIEYGEGPDIDPNEFQPIDVSTALLGSLSSSAEDEVVRYWFPKVTGQVTDETMVVITDKITASNEADIAKVLERYGMLLLVDPAEDNVRQYAKELGVNPNADYSNLELIGLTGLGDQYLSYRNDDDSASDNPVAPASISEDAIWDVAPEEYLRLKAFAEWVDEVSEKYIKFKEYYDNLNTDDDDDDAVQTRGASGRASTRDGGNTEGILKLNALPKTDLKINVTYTRKGYESYKNELYDEDYEDCYFSATCNYRIMPLYQFPRGASDPGGDYYIVETSLNWDCSKTLKKWHQNKHSITNRDSYCFFPVQCTLYTEAKPTKNDYKVNLLPGMGDLWPENAVHETTINEHRDFNLEGSVSAGGNAKSGEGAEGKFEGNLGFGANYSKDQDYTVAEINIDKYHEGDKVGHIFSVADEYYPVKDTNHNPTIYVPKGRNFRKTLSSPESWIWKVNGTKMDTDDSALDIEFVVNPTVAWYSYFIAGASLDRRTYEDVTMRSKASIPPPFRMNVGFITLKNESKDKDGNELHIFKVKATNSDTKQVVFNRKSGDVKFGETLTLGLPANKEYDIEIQMGTTWNNRKKYLLNGWEAEGYSKVENVSTTIFEEAK